MSCIYLKSGEIQDRLVQECVAILLEYWNYLSLCDTLDSSTKYLELLDQEMAQHQAWL